MKSIDTIKLLQECDAGTKMAVASIDNMLDKVGSQQLKNVLEESKSHHESLGNQIHDMLNEREAFEKEPNPIAKGMSRVKTGVKTTMESGDVTIADLITDGCNMGIKSLHKHLNQYEKAEKNAKEMAKQIIEIEEKLRSEVAEYL